MLVLSNVILGLWFALIGADRIDFFGGNGAVVLTPFLVLTPLVVVFELVRRWRERHPVRLSPQAVAFLIVGSALVVVALASVFVSRDLPTSASRAILLAIDVAGTFTVALLAFDRRDLTRVLARGGMASFVITAVFGVMESLFWIGRGPEVVRIGSLAARFGNLQNLGPYPRIAGVAGDANRGGLVILLYLVLIAAGEPRPRLRRAAMALGILLFISTFSRSAALGAIGLLAVSALSWRGRASSRTLAALGIVVVAIGTLLLARPDTVAAVGKALAPAAERISTTSGSAPEHLRLLERGVATATESVSRIAHGLGYGTSFLVLGDMFPGDRYGNFHSFFITMFAESGVVALALLLVLVLTPVVLGGPLRAMVAGTIAFNLFYQSGTEPAFWFTLALAWMTLPVRPLAAQRVRSTRNVTDRESPLLGVNPSM